METKEYVKSIHNIIAYMVDKDIECIDLSGNDIIMLKGEFNLNDKQLRGIIIQCYKNDYSISFEKKKFYITKSI